MKTDSPADSTVRKTALIVLSISLICLLSLVAAGFMSVVALADRIHPVAGQFVFWALLLGAGVCVLYGAIRYAKLPSALVPPVNYSGPQYEAYLDALRARLRANPRTTGKPVETLEEIEAALAELSGEADGVIRNTASAVFLSTALMQNGRLDALVVLFTQIRMVARIARIYVQRPSPRELLRLYANVAATALVASGLESLDIGEMFAPLAASVVPALKGGIPGLSGISALLVRCISTGAANAFLTLRVGEVARRYCEITSQSSAESIRRSATAAAVQHLGRIVRQNGTLVVKKIWEATGRSLVDSGVAKAEDVADAAREWFGRISHWRVRETVGSPD
ncbi:MAG TPA: DUF697 domain-containing protein [Chthoniobacterales bacterium]